MWVLPSRSRPQNLRRLILSCAGMTTPVFVRLDKDDPMLQGYEDLDWPLFWQIIRADRVLLSTVYNDVFKEMPNLDWYGFLADDVMPKTLNWDSLLIAAAGKDGLAYGYDGLNSKATHFVLGGDLVREIGWLALSGLDRLYIDTVWTDIATKRGVMRYLPDVKLTHMHFSNRTAMMDQTYRKPSKNRDRVLYHEWRNTEEVQ